MNKKTTKKTTLGWRERVSLPDLNIISINAKIDTGARTTSIHAEEIRILEKDNKKFVDFKIKHDDHIYEYREEVLRFKNVKDSGGKIENRPVIQTNIIIGQKSFPIEMNLTSRKNMIFPMLIGRKTLAKKYLVDVSLSFNLG